MADAGSIEIRLRARVDQLERDLTDARNKIQAFASKSASVGSGAAASISGIGVAAGFAAGIIGSELLSALRGVTQEAARTHQEFSAIRAELSLSTADFGRLKAAAAATSTEVGNIGQAAANLFGSQFRPGGRGARATSLLQALGIDLQTGNQNPVEQLRQVGRALESIQNIGLRVAASRTLGIDPQLLPSIAAIPREGDAAAKAMQRIADASEDADKATSALNRDVLLLKGDVFPGVSKIIDGATEALRRFIALGRTGLPILDTDKLGPQGDSIGQRIDDLLHFGNLAIAKRKQFANVAGGGSTTAGAEQPPPKVDESNIRNSLLRTEGAASKAQEERLQSIVDLRQQDFDLAKSNGDNLGDLQEKLNKLQQAQIALIDEKLTKGARADAAQAIRLKNEQTFTELNTAEIQKGLNIRQAELGIGDALTQDADARLRIAEQDNALTVNILGLAKQADAAETASLIERRQLTQDRLDAEQGSTVAAAEFRAELVRINLELARGPQHVREINRALQESSNFSKALEDVVSGIGTGTGGITGAVNRTFEGFIARGTQTLQERFKAGATGGGGITGGLGGLFGGPTGTGAGAQSAAGGWVAVAFAIAETINQGFEFARTLKTLRNEFGATQQTIASGALKSFPIVGKQLGIGQELFSNIFGKGLGTQINLGLLTAGFNQVLPIFRPPSGAAQTSTAFNRFIGSALGLPELGGAGGAGAILKASGALAIRPGTTQAEIRAASPFVRRQTSGLLGGALGSTIGSLLGLASPLGPLGAVAGGVVGGIQGNRIAQGQGPFVQDLNAGRRILAQQEAARRTDIEALREQASLAGSLFGTSKLTKGLPERAFAGARFTQGLLNEFIALGLSAEDAEKQIQRATTALGKDFNSLVLSLAQGRALGKKTTDDLRGGIEDALKAFLDLPKAIDASQLALVGLGSNGELTLETLKRAAEDAGKVIGAGIPAGIDAALKSGQISDIGDTIGKQLGETVAARFEQQILEQNLPKKLTEASILGTKGAELLAKGDIAGARQLFAEADRASTLGISQLDKLLGNRLPVLEGFIDRVSGGSSGIVNQGGFGLPTFDSGGFVPGALGSRQIVSAQGGELMVPDGKNVVGLLTTIANAVQRGHQIIVQPAPVVVDGRVLQGALDTNQTRQRTGVTIPTSVGLRR